MWVRNDVEASSKQEITKNHQKSGSAIKQLGIAYG